MFELFVLLKEIALGDVFVDSLLQAVVIKE